MVYSVLKLPGLLRFPRLFRALETSSFFEDAKIVNDFRILGDFELFCVFVDIEFAVFVYCYNNFVLAVAVKVNDLHTASLTE